jgi:hypothetical protein
MPLHVHEVVAESGVLRSEFGGGVGDGLVDAFDLRPEVPPKADACFAESVADNLGERVGGFVDRGPSVLVHGTSIRT